MQDPYLMEGETPVVETLGEVTRAMGTQAEVTLVVETQEVTWVVGTLEVDLQTKGEYSTLILGSNRRNASTAESTPPSRSTTTTAEGRHA